MLLLDPDGLGCAAAGRRRRWGGGDQYDMRCVSGEEWGGFVEVANNMGCERMRRRSGGQVKANSREGDGEGLVEGYTAILATGPVPGCVSWRTVDDLGHGRLIEQARRSEVMWLAEIGRNHRTWFIGVFPILK